MNTKKVAFFLASIAISGMAVAAHAASDDNRFFVKSTSQFWQKSFQVRNMFGDGFTANLNDWQLKVAKVFGIEVTPVKKLNILAASPAPTPKKAAKPANPKTPTDQVAWGVKLVYGGSTDKPSGGEGVKVAILDTGVAKNHPDLKTRVAGCVDFTSAAPVDGKCDDGNGHGTHVAGIVAADGGKDGNGIYGMAPSASILAYKVCSYDGTCFADDVAVAIRYATDKGANVILISEGSDLDSMMIDDAIAYASSHGVMLIAAAGNDGPDNDSIDYPAANPAVVSVSAIDSAIEVPDWSDRGANDKDKANVREQGDIELAAPGVNIQSTWNGNDYSTLSGTSMAAAHVAGLAAKEWQKDAEKPAEATRDILHRFAQDILPTGDDSASGWGLPQL